MSIITNRNDWKRWTLATTGGGPNKNLPLDNLKISPFMTPCENARRVSKYNPATSSPKNEIVSGEEGPVEEEDPNLHINSEKAGRTCNWNPLDWIKFVIKFILWVALIFVSIRVIYSSFPIHPFAVNNSSDVGGNSRGSTSLIRDNQAVQRDLQLLDLLKSSAQAAGAHFLPINAREGSEPENKFVNNSAFQEQVTRPLRNISWIPATA